MAIQTAYSGWFFKWLNIWAFVMQFIVTPALLVAVPLAWVHRLIPLVHVASCLYLWRSPTLAAAGTAYMLFKVLDYSIFRGAKELLYIPLSFDSRYRAKELIDVLGYRTGKGAMSLLVIAAQRAYQEAHLVVSAPALAFAAAVAAGVWALCAIPLGRRAREQAEAHRRDLAQAYAAEPGR